jgi:hypothetical protein
MASQPIADDQAMAVRPQDSGVLAQGCIAVWRHHHEKNASPGTNIKNAIHLESAL